MSDLIARLEALDGPSREVDAEIWGLVHVTPQNTDPEFPARLEKGEGIVSILDDLYERGGWSKSDLWPHYTASLDAALTLESECDLWVLEILKRAWDLATTRGASDLSAVKTDRIARCVVITIMRARNV